MINGTKTVLAFEDGSALVSSSGGDLYWLVAPDGTSTPCSLQKACRYWMQYENTLLIGPRPLEQAEVGDQQETLRVARSDVGRVVEDYGGDEGYSPWQRELLEKLGLTEADLDPTGSLRKSRKNTE